MDPLIGRQRELAALRGWLADALADRPRLVLCGGEPGIGKTRLANELAGVAADKGVPTRWVRAHEGGGSPPYWLWRWASVGLGRSPASATGDRFEAEAERFVLFDDVTRHVFDGACDGGLLLVLEDVHWADEPSLLLLRHLSRELRAARLLVVVTHRTVGAEGADAWESVLPDLVREPATEQVLLHGLTAAETVKWAVACVARRPWPAVSGAEVSEELGRRVHRLTGGNPFYVRAVAQAWEGDGSLPSSVLGVIGRRVERRTPACRQLLAAAAILGEQFPVAVTAALVDRPAAACLPLLDEAAKAGLLEPADVPGDWRFTHALLRDAVEAGLPTGDRIALHRAAALGIERTYAHQLDARLADLARHWAAVAVSGEWEQAVRWATRAAESATMARAYEESARLYRLAVDTGGKHLDDDERCRLLLRLAASEWQSSRLEQAWEACREVVRVAQRVERPDLVAEVALTLEPAGRTAWDQELRHWSELALEGLDGTPGLGAPDPGLRARLLARLAEASVYLGDESMADEPSRNALELADRAADPTAILACLRARQLALSGPEHTAERRVLAQRMVDAGIVLFRPATELWGRLWAIDTFWEDGDLVSIEAALPRVAWCVERIGGPMARWHLLNGQAALAQAKGRFSEALDIGRRSFASLQAIGHPAIGAHLSLLCAIGHHIGHDQTGLLPPSGELPPMADEAAEGRETIFAPLSMALVLAESGRLEEAATAYRRAGPVGQWRVPPYWRVLALATGAAVAVAIGARADVELLHKCLAGDRGRHGVGGAGNTSYWGPVELHLGRMEGFLGRLDEAEADLTRASAICQDMGAAGFAVEADCELAAVVARRAGVGNAGRAQALATRAIEAATRLGMVPWAQSVARRMGATVSFAELSARESEVAELVAQGLTNPQIAAKLYVSERTAQTHVQHILTKLGFSTRSQIAAWVAARIANT